MSMAFGAVGGIILVCFLVKDPINALDEARGSKVESRSKYCLTFVAHNLRVPDVDEQKVFFSSWYHFTKYDLITFTNRNTKKILSKVKELKHNVSSQMPFKPVEFLDKTRHQDRALFSEYALFTYITEEPFICLETQALLKELEEVEPAVEKYSAMWMEPEVAMKRILNCDLSAML
ncbi:hypothetical protein PMIN01_02712 [Paraphaeosphaeria minitans]|uniref:Uncharacterized protein n=1 Tax=Paraphaeosphaeria minitans TaxID=565426 RepID=A0A9P6KV59_9PLEO|nr:hypothetical protein PMIN01_02712 [Paraphaeosphaeria minitans]